MTYHLSRLTLCLASAGLLTATAASQAGSASNAFRGEASHWPMGLILENPTNAADGHLDGMRMKLGRDQAPTDTILEARTSAQLGGTQSFHFSSLFAPGFQDIEIDAMSSGNGVIKGHADGAVTIDTLNGGWMGVVGSVAHREGSTQAGIGSHFRKGFNRYGSSGSEIVTYYIAASQGINNLLPGNQVLEATRGHVGLNTTNNSANEHYDVKAMDYGLGVNEYNVNLPQAIFFRNQDLFLFSVTNEWANNNQVDFAWNQTDMSWEHPNGRDIYLLRYDGSGWGDPLLWVRGQDLGFAIGGELDALDVDYDNTNIIYSPSLNDTLGSGAPSTSQLMIIDIEEDMGQNLPLMPTSGAEGEPRPLLDPASASGTSAADELGVGSEELDGVCTIDPEPGQLSTVAGTPYAHDTATGKPMGLSSIKLEPRAGGTAYWDIQVNGWGFNPQGAVSGVNPTNGLKVEFYHITQYDLLSGEQILWNGAIPPLDRWTLIGTQYRQADVKAVAHLAVPETIINTNAAGSTRHAFLAVQYDAFDNIIRKSWMSAFVESY